MSTVKEAETTYQKLR